MRSQRGDINIIIAALFLPIITLLFAAALDLLRLPLGKLALEEALLTGARDAELDWPGKDPTPSSLIGIEPFAPAALNFCEVGPASNVSCEPSSTDNGVLNASIAANYIAAACANIQTHLNSGTGLIKFSTSNIYLQCGIYKTTANSGSGFVNAVPSAIATTSLGATNFASATGNTTAACGAGAPVFNSAGQSGIASCLTSYIKALPCHQSAACSTTSEVSGGWAIQGKNTTTWTDSYWFVAVAYLRVNSYFGKFALLGGSNPTADNEKIITSYIIMPWTNLSAIDDNT